MKHLRKKKVVTSIRFLDPIPELNIDFYVNSQGVAATMLSDFASDPNAHSSHGLNSPIKYHHRELNKSYGQR